MQNTSVFPPKCSQTVWLHCVYEHEFLSWQKFITQWRFCEFKTQTFPFWKLDIGIIRIWIGHWVPRNLWCHSHSAFLLSSYFFLFCRFLKTPEEIIQSRSDRSDPPESPDSPASPAYKEETLEVSPSSTPDPSSPESIRILSVSPLPWSLKHPNLHHKISPSWNISIPNPTFSQVPLTDVFMATILA